MLLKNAGQDLNGRAAERRGRGVTVVSYLCYPPNALTVAVRRLRTVSAIRVRSHCISLGGLSRMLQSTVLLDVGVACRVRFVTSITPRSEPLFLS